VGNTKPGTRSTLTVFRRGQNRDLSITIAELEPDTVAAAGGKPAARGSEPAKAAGTVQALGVTVAELSDAQRKELKARAACA
jgi:serine protease Do